MDDPLCSKRWRGLTLALLLFPSAALAQEMGATYLNLAQYDEPVVVAQNDDSGARDDGQTSVSSQIEAQRSALPAMGGGPAVDAQGGPAVDPTANVIAILRAATQRQDDLREASERFLLLYIDAAEKLNSARAEVAEKSSMMRYENAALLRAAESRRIDDLEVLRAEMNDKQTAREQELEGQLREAESKRIDAIRAVDVDAAQTDRERTVEQANVLAQQVDTAAEKLASLVNTTEQSVAAAQTQSTNALSTKIDQQGTDLSTRIAALEQAQYVGQGQSSQRDPAFVELQGLVRELVSAQSAGVGAASQRDPAFVAMQDTLDQLVAREATTTGQAEGSSNTIGLIFGGIGALLGFLGIVSAVAVAMRRPQQPAPNGVRQNGNGGAYV